MTRVRRSMNQGRWREAATVLERVILDCRARKAGHAEALWALAVCLDALGHEPGALLALEAAVELDPTALTVHETRDALLSRLHARTADIARSKKERRLASALASRLHGSKKRRR